MIRLPINQPARMTIGISDESGAILALFRMPDGTVFSSDVAMTKARNAYYFSTREGYEVLRDFARQRHARSLHLVAGAAGRQGLGGHGADDQLRRPAALPAGHRPRGTAREEGQRAAARAVVRSLRLRREERRAPRDPGPSRGGNRNYLNQSGIVWFPGSVPLYRGDRVIGGLGVSGDGVEQDDYVSLLGSDGFHPPDSLRVDNSVMTDSKGRAVQAARI